MSCVRISYEGNTDRQYIAIKKAPTNDPRLAAVANAIITREANLLRAIWQDRGGHPHIVQPLSYNSTEHILYFNYCNQHDLLVYMNNIRKARQGFNRQLCLDVADGLQFLHSTCRIAHLDIKTNNILIHQTPYGHVIAKIGDLGEGEFIKKLNNTEADTYTRKGTIDFRAPEITARKKFDEKVDIFSCAFVFYCIIHAEEVQAEFMIDPQYLEYYPNRSAESMSALTESLLQHQHSLQYHPTCNLQHNQFYRGLRPRCDTNRRLARLLYDMWSDDPADRPSAREIIPRLRRGLSCCSC